MSEFTEQLDFQMLQRYQEEAIRKFNEMDIGRPINGGFTEMFANQAASRLATITNPLLKPLEGYDPRDPTDHINMNQGTCCLTWENSIGGICNPPWMANTTKQTTEGRSINPEECTSSGQSTNSTQQTVQMTSPAMWTGDGNWCGLNYMPPVGSRVLVGEGANGDQQIQGYLPADFSSIRPILQMGETCIKGFGDNYIHCRTSDKIDIHASSGASNYDFDDPNKEKQNTQGSTLWIRLNANDCQIKISAAGDSESTAMVMTDNNITITTGTFIVRAREQIIMSAPKIMQN